MPKKDHWIELDDHEHFVGFLLQWNSKEGKSLSTPFVQNYKVDTLMAWQVVWISRSNRNEAYIFKSSPNKCIDLIKCQGSAFSLGAQHIWPSQSNSLDRLWIVCLCFGGKMSEMALMKPLPHPSQISFSLRKRVPFFKREILESDKTRGRRRKKWWCLKLVVGNQRERPTGIKKSLVKQKGPQIPRTAIP